MITGDRTTYETYKSGVKVKQVHLLPEQRRAVPLRNLTYWDTSNNP